MRIILTATDAALFDAWVRHCGDLPEVTFYRGSILDLTVDAVVSPANSFGFMDGGIDQVYRDFFGRKVEQDLQSRIKADHDGELLVGHAVLVHTYNTKIPFLIAAPTMRVPSPITGTSNAYLAARAAVSKFLPMEYWRWVPRHDQSTWTLAFPGMGTGVGQLPPDICAKQVRAAILDVCRGQKFPDRLADAHLRQMAMTKENPGFTVD